VGGARDGCARWGRWRRRASGWRRPGHGVGGVDGGAVGWRRRGVSGARDWWGRLGWKRRGVTGVEAPRGGCIQGWAVGSLKARGMEAQCGGSSKRLVGSMEAPWGGGAVGWDPVGGARDGWGRAVRQSKGPRRRPRPPARPARRRCWSAAAAQGVRDASAAPTRAESAASLAWPVCRSAAHPRACWARAPALGPGPLGASTCWHHRDHFNRIRGSTSSFTHPFLPSKVLN